jgi:hypothetical protein
MRFTQRGNLQHFGNAAHIGQRDPRGIDQILFNQLMDIRAVAKMFARRRRASAGKASSGLGPKHVCYCYGRRLFSSFDDRAVT